MITGDIVTCDPKRPEEEEEGEQPEAQPPPVVGTDTMHGLPTPAGPTQGASESPPNAIQNAA